MSEDNTPRKTLEHAPIGICRAAPEGYFTYANPAAARIFGFLHVEEFLAFYTDIESQFYADPGTRNAVNRYLLEHGYVTDFECRCRRKDGTIIWVMESARIVHDDDGTPAAYEAFFQDIDRRKKAEESYREAMERAEAANHAKTRFLANVSHELRTPLNAVIGFAEILADPGFEDLARRNYQNYSQSILESGRHQLAVVNMLIDLSRAEAGIGELNLQSLDVTEIAQRVVRMLRQRAEHRGQSLHLVLPEGVPHAQADETKLCEVLTNLTGNAVKFTPASGDVTVRVSQDDADVCIVIADTGPGIPQDDIERALEPFGKLARRTGQCEEGTGLGLPLAKQLTEQMGGRFTLTSTPGEGTRVELRLTQA